MCSSWEKVLHLGTVAYLEKDQELFGEGECVDGIYYVKKGLLRLESYGPNGDKAILLYVTERNLFGDAAFFNQMPVYAVYTAVEDSVVYFFSRKMVMERIFPHYPDLVANLFSYLSYKVGVLLHHQCEIMNPDVKGKVCRLLCDIAQYGGNHGSITPKITQEEMARALGLHRATFNKIISELRAEGVIDKVTKSSISVADLPKLVAYAEDPYAL